MEQYFRIHGDNIVECERIANIIINETNPEHINISLVSPSTISMEICFSRFHRWYRWYIDLLPGFNKSGRRRWRGDIFSALRENGSFLDETPDAIITEVVSDTETIICAIEFCSALQAGNQAWQRSGRAFSTGRTGCPYLYIVDFVNMNLIRQLVNVKLSDFQILQFHIVILIFHEQLATLLHRYMFVQRNSINLMMLRLRDSMKMILAIRNLRAILSTQWPV